MSDNNHEIRKHLARATTRILKPLVRILLRNGVSATVFQEIARKVFVEVAHQEFALPNQRQTLARVSVITGLNRKEVSRLHNSSTVDESDSEWFNRAGKVLATWVIDEDFHDEHGKPLALPFNGEKSFQTLVRKHSGDMHPRPVANELLRLGAIEETEQGLRMVQKGYVPAADPASLIDILGMDTAEYIETIDHNIQSAPEEKWLQAKVLSTNLPDEHLQEFIEVSRQLARSTLEELAIWLNEHETEAEDTQPVTNQHVAGLGFFHIIRESKQ